MPVIEKELSTQEVATLTGATYRQLDYWARAGWIPGQNRIGPGSGYQRIWTPEAIEVARWLVKASTAFLGPSSHRRSMPDLPKMADFLRRAAAKGIYP